MPWTWCSALRRDEVTESTGARTFRRSPAVERALPRPQGHRIGGLDATLSEPGRQRCAAKQVSSVELTRAFLARIGQHSELNAFITVDEPGRSSGPAAPMRERASGEAGPLTGIPIAHKDIYCTQGLRTTCGSRMLESFISPYDAHVVEQFDRAGTVLLGKCNMDEFAMGSSNESSYFGPVRNPWARDRVPGGSSGGSAAAVAARMVPAATGTDTGGSIRQPAAFSGVCGLQADLRPGLALRHRRLRFVASTRPGRSRAARPTCALMLNVMAGFDARDSTSVSGRRRTTRARLDRGLTGLRIGLPKEYFGEGLEPGVRARGRGRGRAGSSRRARARADRAAA